MSNARKLILMLPRPLMVALLRQAEHYKKGVNGYVAGAVVRQLLDDKALDAATLASLIDGDR
jgi:hypothetical protein